MGEKRGARGRRSGQIYEFVIPCLSIGLSFWIHCRWTLKGEGKRRSRGGRREKKGKGRKERKGKGGGGRNWRNRLELLFWTEDCGEEKKERKKEGKRRKGRKKRKKNNGVAPGKESERRGMKKSTN
ncbi:hypothetical protein GTI65_16380, partial [Enterococcus faecalis]|uniref:hypothetical protein n=1 Tax=Enterococcus faecalis TaxID=1351 RepID=UPI0013F7304E